MTSRSIRLAFVLVPFVLTLPAIALAQADAGTPEPTPPAAETPAETPVETEHAAEPTATETTPAETTPVPAPPVAVVPPPPPPPPTTEPQPPSTPTPSATGATSAPPVTAIVAGIPIRVTGIAHASIYASQAVESFGQATSVAPTSALNPALLGSQADQPILSFQVQQSRLGLTIGETTPFRGVIEIDFVHFDQSSPVAQAFPRVRILQLEWHPDDHNRIFVGQGWDIFGNAIGPQLLSHSANLVGTLFQAGNIGFMRQQLGWEGRFGDFAIAIAAGMQGNNIGATYNNLEESATPTGSARLMYYLASNSVIGISGIGTAERFTDAATHTDLRTAALGGELFADVVVGPVNIHAEAYVSQNLANTGALNLAQGWLGCSGMGAARTCAMHDVQDAGGYVSGRLNLGEWSITAMYGFAAAFPSAAVQAGYTSANQAYNAAAMTGLPTPTLAGTGTSTGSPGMRWNMTGHVGVWFSPYRGLSFVLEPYFYFTRFVMDTTAQNVPAGMMGAPSDAVRYGGTEVERFAGGGQFTTMFQF